MDILNFISWIRGGRKFTNVDPNTTLLPVGVRDNRRDDKYLAGGISVTDFGNDLGVGIEIPKLIARAAGGEVKFALDFYQSDAWKALNPRIFLYRARKRSRVAVGINDTIIRPKGFVHPSNTAGAQPGGRWWTGEQRINPIGSSAPDPLIRHTEFPLTETVPYKSFTLADLDMYEWIEYIDNLNGIYRQSTAADFPVPMSAIGVDLGGVNGFAVKPFGSSPAVLYPPSGPRSIKASTMKVKFKFAIVIDNPNPTPDKPYLIGPMSDIVTLRFAKAQVGSDVTLRFTKDHVNTITTTVM
jgi:hypothetical protein